jgi:hypothetical protein
MPPPSFLVWLSRASCESSAGCRDRVVVGRKELPCGDGASRRRRQERLEKHVISDVEYSISRSHSNGATRTCSEFPMGRVVVVVLVGDLGLPRHCEGAKLQRMSTVNRAGTPTQCSPRPHRYRAEADVGICKATVSMQDASAPGLRRQKESGRMLQATPRRPSSSACRRKATQAVHCNNKDEKLRLTQLVSSYLVYDLRGSLGRGRWKP